MRIKELIEKLEKLDPEADIYLSDYELGVQLVDDLAQETIKVQTENGRWLPARVWCLYS